MATGRPQYFEVRRLAGGGQGEVRVVHLRHSAQEGSWAAGVGDMMRMCGRRLRVWGGRPRVGSELSSLWGGLLCSSQWERGDPPPTVAPGRGVIPPPMNHASPLRPLPAFGTVRSDGAPSVGAAGTLQRRGGPANCWLAGRLVGGLAPRLSTFDVPSRGVGVARRLANGSARAGATEPARRRGGHGLRAYRRGPPRFQVPAVALGAGQRRGVARTREGRRLRRA